MTLINETHNQVLELPVTTSGRKNGRKLVRAITAESIYRCVLLFLDHILYRRAHFVRNAQTVSPAVLAMIRKSNIQSEFSEMPNPAYFYACFCFCMRKISFRRFSFTLYCHRTSKLNFKDVPRTSEISFVCRNRYPRCPKIVKKPAHF